MHRFWGHFFDLANLISGTKIMILYVKI